LYVTQSPDQTFPWFRKVWRIEVRHPMGTDSTDRPFLEGREFVFVSDRG